jgi:hypothetical protein
MLIHTVSTRKQVLPMLRQAFEGRCKTWGTSTAHLCLEFQIRLRKGKITETICTAKISPLALPKNVWKVTGYEPIEGYYLWFTVAGKFRITKNLPKHWKGE